MIFQPHEVNNAAVIVGEKKGICVEFHNVARTTDDRFAGFEKSRDDILQFFAFSHNDDFVAVSCSVVRRTVERD